MPQENNQIRLTCNDVTNKRVHNSLTLREREPLVESRWNRPKTRTRHQPINGSLRSRSSHRLGSDTIGKIRQNSESNQASGVFEGHYEKYYILKSSILLARAGVGKISSAPCGFSPIQIHFSDFPKSVINRIKSSTSL